MAYIYVKVSLILIPRRVVFPLAHTLVKLLGVLTIYTYLCIWTASMHTNTHTYMHTYIYKFVRSSSLLHPRDNVVFARRCFSFLRLPASPVDYCKQTGFYISDVPFKCAHVPCLPSLTFISLESSTLDCLV